MSLRLVLTCDPCHAEFLDASGAAPEEEGTQRETAAAGGPLHSNSKPLLRPRKRRRPRLKRVQMKRGA